LTCQVPDQMTIPHKALISSLMQWHLKHFKKEYHIKYKKSLKLKDLFCQTCKNSGIVLCSRCSE
jgi:hypothetical protein